MDAEGNLPIILGGVAVAATAAFFFLKGAAKSKKTQIFLNKQRQKVALIEKIEISHDTRLLRFGLTTKDTVLGLPVGKHFKIFCPNPKGCVEKQWNGKEDPEKGEEIERKYTPTSSDDDKGHVDLVIKVYKAGVLERFPDGGKMSQYMETLKIGDSIQISGPWGMNEYKGKGLFKVGSREIQVKAVGMMAGGTGITPMLQIIAAIMKDNADPTTVSLLYANQSEEDILVRDLLEGYAEKHPDRFKLWYTVDRPPNAWKYSQGFINDVMIKEHLPPPGDDTLVLMCGPPPMIKYACKDNLDKLGYPTASQVAF